MISTSFFPQTSSYELTLSNTEVVCEAPTDLQANVISYTEATISWEEGDDETSWNYEYGPTGFVQGSGITGIVNNSTSLNLNSLTLGETYDIYIQSDCETLQSDFELLTWTQPGYGEDCNAPIVIDNLPYHTSDDTANYGYDYGNTPGVNCGINQEILSGYDVVYEYMATSNGVINIAMSDLGSIKSGIFVYTDCDDIGSNCYAGYGNEYNAESYDFDMSVSNGTTYYFVISSIGYYGPPSTTYTLDITEVLCADPVHLVANATSTTETSISWEAFGNETLWYYDYGTAGFAQGTGISGTVNFNDVCYVKQSNSRGYL